MTENQIDFLPAEASQSLMTITDLYSIVRLNNLSVFLKGGINNECNFGLSGSKTSTYLCKKNQGTCGLLRGTRLGILTTTDSIVGMH